MLRGEFIRGDGLRIPNNITQYGAGVLLKAAVRNEVPTFWMALVNCVASPTLALSELAEPTLGVNGYARKAVARSVLGWPIAGILNGENYAETDLLTWTGTGAGFDRAINRLALVSDSVSIAGPGVIALSGALPAALIISPTTQLADRQYKYRIYLR